MAWKLTQASAALILHRMREIEEQVDDPAAWWGSLRTVLERFARTEWPRTETPP